MKDKYVELRELAKRVDEIAKELVNNSEHIACLESSDDVSYVDNKLKLISEILKQVANYCMIGISE